jgi:hypothetical protein
VGGWYYNPLYPGNCYYDLYKIAQVTDGEGQQQGVNPLVYEVPIIAIGIAAITLSSIIYVRRRKKEAAGAKEESGKGPIKDSLLFRDTPHAL